ncbi:MAG: PAS domain S-box protein [Deltaproteobacteria bacterium]|nr:PAS domain S-box protein [Deltaproteobacteria bacterium]
MKITIKAGFLSSCKNINILRNILRACLVLVMLGGLLVLFYLPYLAVKKKTIDAFNREQMMTIRQSALGLEHFFSMYGRALNYAASQPPVIHFNEIGRRMMADFYAIHKPWLIAITRRDRSGKILCRVPADRDGGQGRDTAPKSQNPAGAASLKPLIGVVMVQGHKCVRFSRPVFENNRSVGSITFLVSFDSLAKNFLQTMKENHGKRFWLINQQGIVLFCPKPEDFGHQIRSLITGSPGFQSLAEKMTAGGRGSATFMFRKKGDPGKRIKYHAVFMPITLPGNHFWSIAVSTPEDQVLANMQAFRNKWLAAAALAIGVLFLLCYALKRSMNRVDDEKRQRAAGEQLLRLLDISPIGIIVYDDKGGLKYANRSVVDLFGAGTGDSLIGRNVFAFVHPDYKKMVQERFADVLRGEPTDPAVIKIILPGKVVKDVEITSAPFVFYDRSCGMTILQDVTERLKAEKEQQLLATVIEHTRESIVVTDVEGNIEYVNPAFTRITGYSRDEAIGQNQRLLKSGEHDQAFYEEMWATLKRGAVWEGRLINRKKDGSLYTERVSISPVRDMAGVITHFVAVKRDISHEVELEMQLQQAQKMEAIGTLAGGIAHDFNNILGAIIGFTDISLMQSEADSPIYKNLRNIRKAGFRAADLVRQILTFSRQAADNRKIPVAVVPLLKESLKLLRASLPATIEIVQHLNVSEASVLADPAQIQQMIMNLCTNSFQAMREHGGVLTVTLDELPAGRGSGAALSGGPGIELKVEDTGPGMSPKIIDRIFEPFFTTKEPGFATGLGLSVVHGIVHDLGGTISVESDEHRTCFTIRLPVIEKPVVVQNTDEDQPPGGSESVLIVDDEQAIRETCHMMLSQLGYNVTTSGDPREALALIERQKDRFDLVIADQTMPGMTGLELLHEILRIRPGLPVILCTGFSEQLDEESALREGARQLLLKPVTCMRLAESVRNVLDAKSS